MMLSEEEMTIAVLLISGLVSCYILGWTLDSFKTTCPDMEKPCTTDEQKSLGQASSITFAVSSGFAVLGLVLVGYRYYNMKKGGNKLSPLF